MSLLSILVEGSQRVAASAARRTKVEELASILKLLEAEEIDIAVLYLSGETPQGKAGISSNTLRAAATERPVQTSALTIADVDRTLAGVAGIRGTGSSARREQALRDLFARASAAEQQFLLRLIFGEMRQGALAGVMIEAIGAAAQVPAARVRQAAMYSRSLGAVARVALLQGAGALTGFRLELFAPAAPMLAQTAVDVAQALHELGAQAAFEWKMDGARIQVHKSRSEVRIYTRSLNDITDALPEITQAARALPADSLVLDGEAIAFDAAGRPHPFQITMRRFGRKLNVESLRAQLPIRAFFFDCLHCEGRSIVDQSTRQRVQALQGVVPESMRVPRLVTGSAAKAGAFYDAAIQAGHEGLMAKSLDAPYEAGNRGASWFKIKRTHTLDLIVLAAEWGHGRRAGKLSNLHLGAWEPASGEHVMLGKTFKGSTDVILEWQTQELLARETHRDSQTVHVRPELVVEIAFSDLQASVRYPAGLALRLARVKRYRTDKRSDEADTMATVRKLYAAQAGAAA